jgi:putative flavoprotein involved in K+ transport
MSARAQRVERYELVVIGGGQAGLSAGYWLSKQDIDFVILDAEQRTGDSWRKRWDSLRLFTPARYSSLPGMNFPTAPYQFPSRDEIADYLEWYATTFELPVRHGVRVTSVRKSGQLFEIATNGSTFEAENVIVATGAFQKPNVPIIASGLSGAITQLHSSGYQSPNQLPPGDVLCWWLAQGILEHKSHSSYRRRETCCSRAVLLAACRGAYSAATSSTGYGRR